MKPHSFKNRNQERGVALVLTVAILAMILVLITGYATLSRTESLSSANYRDYVASKYVAQGALNRAIADIALHYASDSNVFNSGLGTIYSTINANTLNYNNLTAEQTSYATDIESRSTQGGTGKEYEKDGQDDVVDHVILAGQVSKGGKPVAGEVPQWIGLKDEDGLLLGRMAYCISAEGINVNVMGNMVPGLATNKFGKSTDMNSRNEGVSVGELNLPAALMAISTNVASGWNNNTAKDDAIKILNYRYTGNATDGSGFPGDVSSALYPSNRFDQIDNNGDGFVDNDPDQGGDTGGLPGLFLKNSDGTINSTLQPIGRNAVIQDLKKLADGSVSSDPAFNSRFANNFAEVQRTLTTQSSIPIGPDMIDLNDSRYPTPTNLFPRIITETKVLRFPTTDQLLQAQVVANLVTYGTPPDSTGLIIPFVLDSTALTKSVAGTYLNTNIVGVARVPYINEVVLNVNANLQVTKNTAKSSSGSEVFDVDISFDYEPEVEHWYPFTNSWANDLTVEYQTYQPSFITRDGAPVTSANVSGYVDTDTITKNFGPINFGSQLINPNRFAVSKLTKANFSGTFTYEATRTKAGSTDPKDWDFTSIPVLGVTNINFGIKTSYKSNGKLIDTVNPTVIKEGVKFTQDYIGAGIIKALDNGGKYSLASTLALGLDDPRVKYFIPEYIGPSDSDIVAEPDAPQHIEEKNAWGPYKGFDSLGHLNWGSNLSQNTCNWGVFGQTTAPYPDSQIELASRVFCPDAQGPGSFWSPDDRDYHYTRAKKDSLPKGIAPKTFYVKHLRNFSSPAEIGRVHRAERWRTVNLVADSGFGDNAMLNVFTTVNNHSGNTAITAYEHGRVNINTRPDHIATWAALFCGMPIDSQINRDAGGVPRFIDLDNQMNIDPAFPQCRALGQIVGRAAGSYTHMGSLVLIEDFRDLRANHSDDFPKGDPAYNFQTDEDKEQILNKIYNLVGTQSQGNLFSIWAWGQTLRGDVLPAGKITSPGTGKQYPSFAGFKKFEPAEAAKYIENLNKKRIVTGETLVVAMVRPEIVSGTPDRVNLRTIYYRYNPDLQVNDGY